jgi:hypothetical protein
VCRLRSLGYWLAGISCSKAQGNSNPVKGRRRILTPSQMLPECLWLDILDTLDIFDTYLLGNRLCHNLTKSTKQRHLNIT